MEEKKQEPTYEELVVRVADLEKENEELKKQPNWWEQYQKEGEKTKALKALIKSMVVMID